MSRGRGAAGLALALALLLGAGFFGVRAALRGDADPATLEERYAADDRVSPLLYDCGFGKTFDVSTADMIPVLVSKLDLGQRDVLRAAKAELAAAGEAAIPALRQLFQDAYGDVWRGGVLQNVLAAVTLMDGPWGVELLRAGASHPQEAVRLTAIKGLGKHGVAEDYDLVWGFIPMATSSQAAMEIAQTLDKLDPERFAKDFATWVLEGTNPDTWPFLIRSALDARDPETVARLREAAELRDETLVPFLLAPAARDGDAEAMRALRERLDSERPGQQQLATQALAAVGQALEAGPLLHSRHTGVRLAAAEALAASEPAQGAPAEETEQRRSWLRVGLEDADDKVRETCLTALLLDGDELARARALDELEGNLLERGAAIRALRRGWERDEAGADEAFARLVRVYESARGGSRDVIVSVLQAIGQVPLRDAAEFLLDLGRQSTGTVRGLDAFRWFVGQVWNTGPEGQALLRETLATEPDPMRRLSLIEYVWQDHGDASRACLLEIVADDARHPFERLYAADRLTHVGPATVVAPVIKRAYLACTHPQVRPALQCLLWTWYGQHYEH